MKKIYTLLLLAFSINAMSQTQYRSPLDIPLVLSANFGELRPNHFHSGIDLKTEGVENKPVYSIADGYVSRLAVSPSGYGLALYISHPSGQTSLYAHLNKFAPKIDEYVKERQYEKESYSIDVELKADELPVKKGDFIAYSGNTGSSGGPHVHFEIRETESNMALDALMYYKTQIPDNVPPLLRGVAVYPIEGKGVVNGCGVTFRQSIAMQKKGGYAPMKDLIKVWGRIGVGVYSIDRMTGTNNIYGVHKVRLYCDNIEVFSSDITAIDFNKTRMINSLIDFDYWYRHRVFYVKSFVEPGNKLDIYKTANGGYIDVKEERFYDLRYELEDFYGNVTEYSFAIQGKEQVLPLRENYSQFMHWDEDNNYSADLFSISVPAGCLYDDIYFTLKRTASSKHRSSLYEVNDSYTPLDKACDVKIKMTKDSLVNKKQYGIVKVNGGNESWIGGVYNNGAISAKIRELGGVYAVSVDTQSPDITPIAPAKWNSQGAIKIRLTDNKSGIASYRGTMDGKFILFENDVKSPVYTYRIDSKRIGKGKHAFEFVAIDACGNTSIYTYEFTN